MAVSPIIAYGFGSWGSVNKVPTLGFGIGVVVTPTPTPTPTRQCVAFAHLHERLQVAVGETITYLRPGLFALSLTTIQRSNADRLIETLEGISLSGRLTDFSVYVDDLTHNDTAITPQRGDEIVLQGRRFAVTTATPHRMVDCDSVYRIQAEELR